jgi:hypothetical protein
MLGERQPLDVGEYAERLSRIIRKLGGIASGSREPEVDAKVKELTLEAEGILGILWCATCSDREEALSDEDAANEQAMQDYIEEIESLPENRGY